MSRYGSHRRAGTVELQDEQQGGVSERQQRSIIDVISEGVVVVGLDGALVQANPAARTILGHRLDPSADDPDWWRRLDARGRDGSEMALNSPGEEVRRTGRDLRDVPVSVRSGDGARLTLQLNYRLLHDADDAPAGLVVSFRDVTEQEAEHERLAASGTRLRDAHELAALSSWEWDVRRDRVVVLQGLPGELDERIESGAGIDALLDAIAPEDRAKIARGIDDLRTGTTDQQLLRYRYRLEDGRTTWVETRMRAVRDVNGGLVVVCGTTQDVTASQRAAAELADGRDFLRSTMDSLGGHVAVLDAHGVVLTVNAAWERFASENDGVHARTGVGSNYLSACDAATGDEDAARAAAALRAIIDGTLDGFTMEYPCHSPAGDRWFTLRADPHRSTGPTRVVVQHTDVTERVRDQRELRSARDYQRAMADSMAQGLCTLDMEGRAVYMNQAGEDILGRSTRELMGKVFHDEVHFRHPDGTPYPIEDCPIFRMLHGGESLRSVDDVFVRSDGTDIPVEYSASPFKTPEGICGTVLLFADVTERKARQARVAHDLEDLAWVERINEAIEQDRLVLHAQPIIDLATGATVQHELLIRMLDADGTLIPPGAFLPAAERYGLIRDIDRWVVRRAAELSAQGHTVELNISADSLGDRDFAATVERELRLSGADCSLMVIELTETALLRDEEAGRRFIDRVQRLGCKLALDDFGTGYGGFTYLKHLDIDYLKIDIEFVRDLPHNAASQHVVRAVVTLAHDFGQKTIAEGVEDAETLQLLRELGVDYAQGYHTGRPAPVEGTAALHTPDERLT